MYFFVTHTIALANTLTLEKELTLQPGNFTESVGDTRQFFFTGYQLASAALIYSIEATLVWDQSRRRRQEDGENEEAQCALLLVGNGREDGPAILLASNPVRYKRFPIVVDVELSLCQQYFITEQTNPLISRYLHGV